MKHFILSFLILLQSINLSWAEDIGQAVLLQQGQPAPFKGYLIDDVKAQRIRLIDLDLEFSNKKNEILQQQFNLLNDQNTRNVAYIGDLSKQLTETKDGAIWTKIGFFLLGSLVTTGIAFGVSRVIR